MTRLKKLNILDMYLSGGSKTPIKIVLTAEMANLIRTWDTVVSNEKGLVHNQNGPALISHDNTCWLINGLYHRTDGPAIINSFLGKSWWINGNLHRDDGPADISLDGEEKYFLNGKEYTKEDWLEEIANIKLKRILDL
jgi:hypothetical protein